MLGRDDKKDKLYLLLPATIVVKQTKLLYVFLDFKNCLELDALVASGAYVSEAAQIEWDRNKQHSRINSVRIVDPPSFQKHVAVGQLEKPTATTILKFDKGRPAFEKDIMVIKNVTGFNTGLRFMRHICVISDSTHGLNRFLYLKMHVRSATSKTSIKLQPAITGNSLTNPLITTGTTTPFVDHRSYWNTKATVTQQTDKSKKQICFNQTQCQLYLTRLEQSE